MPSGSMIPRTDNTRLMAAQARKTQMTCWSSVPRRQRFFPNSFVMFSIVSSCYELEKKRCCWQRRRCSRGGRHGEAGPEAARAERRLPVHVVDYQFRHWTVNAATAPLVGGSIAALQELLQHGVHGFDVVFDSRLPARRQFTHPEAVERERVYRFKAHKLYRRH